VSTQLSDRLAPAAYGLASVAAPGRQRWFAVGVICLGVLMIVLDTTVVNVALPSIRQELAFTDSSLVWVLNAYMLTFGGALLLCGRLGDLYGGRRLFLIGIVTFTSASIACGMSRTPSLLIAARAVQGVGGAAVLAVSLSLIVGLFEEDPGRAKAIGVYSFVCTGGGSVGLLVGGVLTSAVNWHWVFLINLPVGIVVFTLARPLLWQITEKKTHGRRLDVWGTVTVTTAVVLAIYAVQSGNVAGWGSVKTLFCLGSAVILGALLLLIEARVSEPLIPLRIFKLRNFTVANVVSALWTAGACAWYYMAALYMQLVLGYGPMRVAVAFLPANIVTATLCLGVSAVLITRFGLKAPLCTGFALAASGLALFARAPADASLVADILPGMILLGIGGGIAFNPLLVAALTDISQTESGLASGVINTVSLLAGAFGLAVLANLSSTRTHELLARGLSMRDALMGGFHMGLSLGAVCAIAAAILGGALLRTRIKLAQS